MHLESFKPGDLLVTRGLKDNMVWLLIGVMSSTDYRGKLVTFWWSISYCCIVVNDRADPSHEFPENDYGVIRQR